MLFLGAKNEVKGRIRDRAGKVPLILSKSRISLVFFGKKLAPSKCNSGNRCTTVSANPP
jgi:hypothetical protein